MKERLDRLEGKIGAMDLKLTMNKRPKEFSDVKCSDCGKMTRVPFKIRFPNKPIYCDKCWKEHRERK